MAKRKLNAVISLLVTVMLLMHAIFLSIWMLSGGSTTKPAGFWAWVLMGMVIIHALISIDLAVSAHAENENRKGKKYPKMNAATIIQRVSGVVMVPATGFHIAGATGVLVPPQMVHAIVPPLFFTIVLTHISVSASKALVTLGIGSAKLIKAVDLIMKLICGATLIAGVIGIYLRTFTEAAV